MNDNANNYTLNYTQLETILKAQEADLMQAQIVYEAKQPEEWHIKKGAIEEAWKYFQDYKSLDKFDVNISIKKDSDGKPIYKIGSADEPYYSFSRLSILIDYENVHPYESERKKVLALINLVNEMKSGKIVTAEERSLLSQHITEMAARLIQIKGKDYQDVIQVLGGFVKALVQIKTQDDIELAEEPASLRRNTSWKNTTSHPSQPPDRN